LGGNSIDALLPFSGFLHPVLGLPRGSHNSKLAGKDECCCGPSRVATVDCLCFIVPSRVARLATDRHPYVIPQMNDRRPTRRRFFVFAIIALAVIASFCAGRYWEHFKNGRWYEVHDHRAYDGKFGTIRLSHVTDTQGWPFLDPGDSVISLQNESGLDVRLYQSKRVFQESRPWVEDVQIDGDYVKWSDGVYRYSLKIEPAAPTTQP
jgi:hypothetical protein